MANMYYRSITGEQYLIHHGIRGQKWGIRRFQNKDGTLTAAGKKRQEKLEAKKEKKRLKMEAKAKAKADKAALEKQRRDDSLEGMLSKGTKMSDAELRKAIARMDLEVSYRNAVERYKAPEVAAKKSREDKINKVKGAVAESVGKVAANAAKNLVATAISKTVNTAFGTEIISKKELLTGQLEERKPPKKTNTDVDDFSKLTDSQVKDILDRTNNEKRVRENNLDLQDLRKGVKPKNGKPDTADKLEKAYNNMSEEEQEEFKKRLGHSDEDDDEYAGDPIPLDYEEFEEDDIDCSEAIDFVQAVCAED